MAVNGRLIFQPLSSRIASMFSVAVSRRVPSVKLAQSTLVASSPLLKIPTSAKASQVPALRLSVRTLFGSSSGLAVIAGPNEVSLPALCTTSRLGPSEDSAMSSPVRLLSLTSLLWIESSAMP